MTRTLSEVAHKRIREKIACGELGPRSRLHDRALAVELGASPGTVRAAIHRTISEGLVEYLPNSGAYVRRLGREDVGHLLDVREAMECLAVARAAEIITIPQLRRLCDLCDAMAEIADAIQSDGLEAAEGERYRRLVALDMEFHETLIGVAANLWLTKAVGDLLVMEHSAMSKPSHSPLAGMARTIRAHRALVDALHARDAEAARSIMVEHLQHPREAALRQFGKSCAPTASHESALANS